MWIYSFLMRNTSTTPAGQRAGEIEDGNLCACRIKQVSLCLKTNTIRMRIKKVRIFKKIAKIVLITAVSVVVLLFFLNYFLAYRLESYLRKELVGRVSDATDQFYMLSYDNLSINLLNGELRIEGIEFRPDSAVFDQWKAQDRLPDLYFDAKIDAIDFRGINLIWRWSYERLDFDVFEIQSPVLDIYHSCYLSGPGQKMKVKKTDVKSEKKKTEMHFSLEAPLIELVSPSWTFSMDHLLFNIQSVSSDRFRMMNAKVGLNNENMSVTPTIDVELKGLYYDHEKRDFDVKDVYFHTKNVDWAFDNGFYNLHAGNILFSGNELTLDDIRLESPYSKEEFAVKHPKHADRLGLNVKHFSVRNINVLSFVKNKTLVAENAVAEQVFFEVYKNRQLPVQLKYKPMIYEFIQKAPVLIDVDCVTVRDMDLVYEELSRKGKRPGKLFFTGINGVFHDVTNIVKHPDQYIVLNADAKFMGNGSLTAEWKIPVDSLNKSFLLDAHMSKFDFSALNAMITPAAPIRITSGQVNDLTFSIKGTDLLADIRMRLLYENLIVELLKEKEDGTVERKFNSALVNMVVRNSNPRRKNEKPYVTNITSVKRDPNRSTFNYIWLLLRPAIADVVGVSQAEQEAAGEVAEFVKAIKSLFHPDKNEEGAVKEPV